MYSPVIGDYGNRPGYDVGERLAVTRSYLGAFVHTLDLPYGGVCVCVYMYRHTPTVAGLTPCPELHGGTAGNDHT